MAAVWGLHGAGTYFYPGTKKTRKKTKNKKTTTTGIKKSQKIRKKIK
jgi:hypothetical protein